MAEYQRQRDLKHSQREKADGLLRDTNQNDCGFQQECKPEDSKENQLRTDYPGKRFHE